MNAIRILSTSACLLICVFKLKSQETEKFYDSFTFQVGITVNANKNFDGTKGTFPSIRSYIGVALTKYFGNLILNGSTNLGFYNKSLGNCLTLESQDNQIDLTSSFQFGYASMPHNHSEIPFWKASRSINNLSFNNIITDGDRKFHIIQGVHFIVNNHHRNQTVGSTFVQGNNLSIYYYNDGPYFSQIGLGDGFDRFWTGGGGLIWHHPWRKYQNILEFSFDQFTGYRRSFYEAAKLLGTDVFDYTLLEDLAAIESKSGSRREFRSKITNFTGKSNFNKNFNSSSYNLKINGGCISPNLYGTLGFNIGLLGSLRFEKNPKQKRYYSLQDFIHINSAMPLHQSQGQNSLLIGFNYNPIFDKL